MADVTKRPYRLIVRLETDSGENLWSVVENIQPAERNQLIYLLPAAALSAVYRHVLGFAAQYKAELQAQGPRAEGNK